MTKQLYSLMGNSQKLDGGAMFGNAPKALWERWCEADEYNRIDLACRALLVKEKDRHILFETGIGSFFEPKYKERYGVVESEHVLLNSLEAIGLTHEDIDIVVLSHMHFDHAGGLLSPWVEGEESQLLFPNARYMTGKRHWQRALNPHYRDRASFLPELNQKLIESQRLHLIEGETDDLLGDDYHFSYSDGHTPGLLLTHIKLEDITVIFTADLIPATPWIHLPITMGYDRFPEILIEEKLLLLQRAEQQGDYLFFTHDPQTALANVQINEKGKYSKNQCIDALYAYIGKIN